MTNTNRLLAVTIALALAATTMPTVWGQGPPAGGSGGNAAPVIDATSLTPTTNQDIDVGTTLTIGGVVTDNNKASDLDTVTLSVTIDDESTSTSTNLVGTVPDTLPTTKPASPNAGDFFFWTEDAPKKELSFAYDYTFSSVASYTWSVTATDDDGATDTVTDWVVVRAFQFQVDETTFYQFDGAGPDGATVWGDWAGLPGAAVEGKNLLKITNGKQSDQDVEVKIELDKFDGADGVETIDLLAAGVNFQFHYAIVAQFGDAPAQSVFAPATMSGTSASATITIPNPGENLYVYYTMTLPDPLVDQTYSATATATALP